jgi:hypothetical protein
VVFIIDFKLEFLIKSVEQVLLEPFNQAVAILGIRLRDRAHGRFRDSLSETPWCKAFVTRV